MWITKILVLLTGVCATFLASPIAGADKWYIYHDSESSENHGIWSNVMPEECGDRTSIRLDEHSHAGGKTAVKLTFDIPNTPGWCGIAVASKEGFWGKPVKLLPKGQEKFLNKVYPGFDLTPYNKLIFSIKGSREGGVVEVRFAITGEQGEEEYADSAPFPINCGRITLSNDWETKTCDLNQQLSAGTGAVSDEDRRLFLGRVITPFVVIAAKSYNHNNPVVVYLDEVYFEE
jgi:hypothetical protein